MASEFLQHIERDLLLDICPMPRALIGAGLFERVGVEAHEMGFRRALLVSTGLRGTGIVEETARLLRAAGVEPVIYAGVESNPKDTQVMEIASLYATERCDGYVSVGGGTLRFSDLRFSKRELAIVTDRGFHLKQFPPAASDLEIVA